MIKNIEEFFIQDTEGNTIFQITQEAIKNTITVLVIRNGIETQIGVNELGEGYFQVQSEILLNEELKVNYQIRVSDSNEDVNLLQRIRLLEEQHTALAKMMDILTQAVDQRVEKHSFRIWLNQMEKSFGKPVLPDTTLMGIQSYDTMKP